ncbi:alpha/beta fold hydrolase [Plantactinospora mayteni]|uniref:Thioesterase n=1 Tax=Plantactinospora mayteni TaxID=566021 RepID=A0ABQ4EI96_9ACTN|nr:alpha/beta fold hydrolase [Plantactinospora mayteni]GIG94465.1 thioesterase [Plantactinospora mayteni]
MDTGTHANPLWSDGPEGIADGTVGEPATVEVTDWFIPLSDPAATTQVYAFPQAGGGCATFAGLADLLAPDLGFRGLNLPGRQARFAEPPRIALGPLIDDLATALARHHRPILLGYCSGALLAFLVARRLRARGLAPPAALVVASYAAPHQAEPRTDLHRLPSADFWREILSYGGVRPEVAGQPDFREIFEVALRADHELFAGYEYTDEPPLAVPVTVIVGDADHTLPAAVVEGWRDHTTREFRTVAVPGGHWLLDRDLRPVAEAVRDTAARLAAAETTARGSQSTGAR